MAYQDKTLACADCGASFVFSAQEQELFAQKGYTNEPRRCPACRQASKARRGDAGMGQGAGGSRQMFPARCAQCGKDTQVPFQPRPGRPVYCFECYGRMRTSR